ncbi:MAG: hypothetical protein N3G48_07665 [Sulfolobales archaeon]|nr:hypothetical protein [Sulfolobales archaeon]
MESKVFVRKLGRSGKILLPKEVVDKFRGHYIIIHVEPLESRLIEGKESVKT